MKTRLHLALALVALVSALALAQPAAAMPVNYGTGIHHWVLTCGPFSDGHWTVQYVSSSVCPAHPPSGCSCALTTYDFPYNNPYPYRVATSSDPKDPGNVHVLVDSKGAIQCGDTVPSCGDHGSCGDPFNAFPADATQIDRDIVDLVESLRAGIEEQTGAPVQSFSYFLAVPIP